MDVCIRIWFEILNNTVTLSDLVFEDRVRERKAEGGLTSY